MYSDQRSAFLQSTKASRIQEIAFSMHKREMSIAYYVYAVRNREQRKATRGVGSTSVRTWALR